MKVYSILDTWCADACISPLYASEESALRFKREHEAKQDYDWRYYNDADTSTRFILSVEPVFD